MTEDNQITPQEDMSTREERVTMHQAFVRMEHKAPDVEAAWQRFSRITDNPLPDTDIARKGTGARKVLLGFVIGIAASIAVFIGYNHYFVKTEELAPGQVFAKNDEPQEVLLKTDGGEKQVITGKKVSFTGKVNENADARMLSVTTPRGKDYQLTLPDGSRVWMNADSKLQFPSKFSSVRKVRVSGEAYFEVKHDASHPFVVETDYFSTTVLGTVFNVRAYSAADANVVLVSGRIRVATPKAQSVLSAGQLAQLLKGDKLGTVDVDTYPYTQWKDGFFYFNDHPMKEIAKELGRWYNVNIIFENQDKMNMHYHFVADRHGSLQDAIKNLNELGGIHASIEDGALVIR